MRAAKAVILARGLGKRMRRADPSAPGLTGQARSLAQRGLKSLIPLRGRPFLDYVVGSLLEAGLGRLCLVVAPDGDQFMDYASRAGERTGAEITWAVQSRPLGTADAVLAAERFVGDDPFVMVNADNLYPAGALRRLAQVSERCCCAAAFERDELLRTSNFSRRRVGAFAVLVAGEDGRLEEIVEKPAEPQRYVRAGRLLVSMNLYRFTREVFDACRQVQPHPVRGELELTAAVCLMLRAGSVPFRVIEVGGPVLDLTSRADLRSLERLLEGRSPGFPREGEHAAVNGRTSEKE